MNGLILVLEHFQPLTGVIHLMAGIILNTSGLITSFMMPRREVATILGFLVTISFAVGQLGFLGTFDIGITTGNPIIDWLLNPWIAFFTMFIWAFCLIVLCAVLFS